MYSTPRLLKVLGLTALALVAGFVASPGGGSTAEAGAGCYTLTMNVGSGSGSITNMPSSAGGCPTNQYPPGYPATVVAEPASGYVFSSWSGTDYDFANPTTVTMSSGRKVTAYFTWNCFRLTTNIGTGSGSVAASPTSAGGCPANHYPSGYPVTVTATPAPGYAFSSWSGTDNNSANPTTVTMTGDRKVTANFAWNCYTLTRNVGSGSGSINRTPTSSGGCPIDQYWPGTQVTLLAKPAPGSSFISWSGTANNGANPSWVIMNGNRKVTAFFTGPAATATRTPPPTATRTPAPTATRTPTPTPAATPTPKDPNGDTDGDTVPNASDADDDNDGCTDVQELDSNATLGGLRDPHNFWDFFDTPLRDSRVDIGDVGRVVARFGATGDPNVDPLTPPPPSPAYHPAFDRSSPAPGRDLWDLLPPDGAIDIRDIGAVIAQFGHSCT